MSSARFADRLERSWAQRRYLCVGIDPTPGQLPERSTAGRRGDIEHTNAAYAPALFAYYDADAVTAHPYLGGAALAPFLRYARAAAPTLPLPIAGVGRQEGALADSVRAGRRGVGGIIVSASRAISDADPSRRAAAVRPAALALAEEVAAALSGPADGGAP